MPVGFFAFAELSVKEHSSSGPSRRRMSTARCTLLMAGKGVGSCVHVTPPSLE